MTGGGAEGAVGFGSVEQALSRLTSAIRTGTLRRIVYMGTMGTDMWILMVEAGVALFLFVFIVWWTMFAGRRRGEIDDPAPPEEAPAPVAAPVAKPPEAPAPRD